MAEFQSFKVSRFQSSKVPKIYNFKIVKFQSFNDPYYQHSISCFWKILIPSSRFSNILSELSGFAGGRVSYCSICLVSKMFRFTYIIVLKRCCILFLDYLECPGVSKDESDWFWESWSHAISPNTNKNDDFVWFSLHES